MPKWSRASALRARVGRIKGQGRQRWHGLGRNLQRGDDFEQAIDRAQALADLGSFGELDYAQSFGLQVDLAIQSLRLGTSREHLWAAAYIIRGGCGDDAWEDFREGLISRGRVVFEAAVFDPDSLAKLAATRTGFTAARRG